MASKAQYIRNRKKEQKQPSAPAPTDSQEFMMNRKKRDKLVFMCVLTGLLGGAISVAYRWVLTWEDALRVKVFKLADSPLRIALLFAGLIILGAITGLITQSEPLISGSGIPQVEGQIHDSVKPRWLRVMVKKFIAGAIAILGGLSLGREGPSIQLGAMAAQGLAEKTGQSDIEKKYLIVSGSCAGLAAAFNAPLAGAMFGLEEIHKNFSKLALLSALLAAIAADLLSKAFFGTVSSLNIGLVTQMPFRNYIIYLVVGVVMGFVGAFYNFVLLRTQKLYKRLSVPVWVRIVIPFVISGAIGFFCPDIQGGGHDVITRLNNGEYAFDLILILLAGKFIFSMISYGSGAPGGIFFPLLVIGALTGTALGKLGVMLFGLEDTFVANVMLLGMVGMFAGVVRAPVTGIILVVEMSASLTQLAGLTITAAVACMAADYIGSEPIYDSLLKAMDATGKPERESDEHHIIELPIPLSSPLAGMTVRDVEWPKDCLVVSVLHGSRDKAELPKGDTVIRPGDTVCVACPADMACELRCTLEREFSESIS